LEEGLVKKKIEPIMEMYPNILNDVDLNDEDGYKDVALKKKIEMVKKVKGVAEKTAELFVSKIAIFIQFMKECGLEYKLNQYANTPASGNNIDKTENTNMGLGPDVNHPLYNKTIVFTGFRDDKMEKDIKKLGGKIGSSVSKNTFIVVTKDKDDKTGKVLQAEKIGVKVMNPGEFVEAYIG
jgi:DNA ligase (NAD+)